MAYYCFFRMQILPYCTYARPPEWSRPLRQGWFSAGCAPITTYSDTRHTPLPVCRHLWHTEYAMENRGTTIVSDPSTRGVYLNDPLELTTCFIEEALRPMPLSSCSVARHVLMLSSNSPSITGDSFGRRIGSAAFFHRRVNSIATQRTDHPLDSARSQGAAPGVRSQHRHQFEASWPVLPRPDALPGL